MTTRRDLFLAAAAAGVGALLPRGLAAGTRLRNPLQGVGVQLYTLRTEMRADPEGTLARIAQLGFTEIEWWGDFGRTPQQLRALLDRHALTTPAWHLAPQLLEPAQLDATLRIAQTMGHRHLIVAWLPPQQRSADGFRRIGETLSIAGRRLAQEGIRTGYHNHDFEFARVGDETIWDILLANTDASVVDLELDCYWAFKAGHDPIAMLSTYRDRITHLHIKDSAGPPEHRQVDVGRGVIDWQRLLEVATAGRVQHVFVEHDEPADAWATVQAGREHLRRLGY